jgi:hypothetical protein
VKRRSFEEAMADLAHAASSTAVLEAAGHLVLLGKAPARGTLSAELDLGAGELEDDAFALIHALPTISIDALRNVLSRRDAVEVRLVGAEALFGRPLPLSFDDETALVAFEEAVRPHLWRLTAFNEWRALEVDQLRPEHRARFWWWSEAAEIDPQGALHLDAVAELVARFPEAEARLQKLAATDLLLRDRGASVIDLSQWIRERLRPVAMAANTGAREQVLYQHSAFALSFLAPGTLLIDLLEPCGPERPRLLIGARVIEAEPVANALERYRIDLSLLGEAARAELVVTLVSGVVRVDLPPST